MFSTISNGKYGNLCNIQSYSNTSLSLTMLRLHSSILFILIPIRIKKCECTNLHFVTWHFPKHNIKWILSMCRYLFKLMSYKIFIIHFSIMNIIWFISPVVTILCILNNSLYSRQSKISDVLYRKTKITHFILIYCH